MHYRYGGGVKLFTCRNAAGLTAAKLAAKHGHVHCAQHFNTLKKLVILGAGGAAGDVRDTLAAAGEDAGGAGDGGTGSDTIGPPVAVVTPPTAYLEEATVDRVSVVPEAGRTSNVVTTSTAGDLSTTVGVVAAQSACRGNQQRYMIIVIHTRCLTFFPGEPGLSSCLFDSFPLFFF